MTPKQQAESELREELSYNLVDMQYIDNHTETRELWQALISERMKSNAQAKEIAELRKEREWISVKERLPENKQVIGNGGKN